MSIQIMPVLNVLLIVLIAQIPLLVQHVTMLMFYGMLNVFLVALNPPIRILITLSLLVNGVI